MRREFIIQRNGRDFVLYSGLLDLAHERGLTSILTQLIQVPTADNGNVAICSAIATVDGKTFSGIGDASPENVGPQIRAHLVRMAETRAKARALRDAVNVAMCSLEELGPQVEESGAPARPVPLARPLARIPSHENTHAR